MTRIKRFNFKNKLQDIQLQKKPDNTGVTRATFKKAARHDVLSTENSCVMTVRASI